MPPSQRPVRPLLNIFWLLLFAPVIWILVKLWKNDLPWMDSEPFRHLASRDTEISKETLS